MKKLVLSIALVGGLSLATQDVQAQIEAEVNAQESPEQAAQFPDE